MAEPARVVVAGGHMIDRPDRVRPRFPPDQVARVAAQIDLAMTDWRVGAETTLITGGASGADMLAAEAGYRRGARIQLYLPLPLNQFELVSVRLAGPDWSARFKSLIRSPEVQVLGPPDEDESPFERVNERIVEAALGLHERPHVLVVWDGEAGDGPGGTWDLIARFRYDGHSDRLCIIHPRRPDTGAG